MELSSQHSQFLDGIITEQVIEDQKIREKVKQEIDNEIVITENKLKNRLQWTYAFCILILFLLSFSLVASALYFTFNAELDLIKSGILKPEDRSINATSISALIASTIAQSGAAFYFVSKKLFI